MSRCAILFVPLRMGRLFALALLAVLSLNAARAQEDASKDASQWHVLIEPAFMFPEVSFPIPGAKDTVYVPGYMAGGEPQYFTKEDWDAQQLTWDKFRTRAEANATEKKFSAELVRDSHKVVQYAAITSDDPLTATMILSPDFLKRFNDIFGPTVLVAIPNRFTVFVFPVLASEYQNFGPLVLRTYEDSTWKVSREIFEVSPKGVRAIGSFEE